MASSHGSRDDVAVETTSPVEEPVSHIIGGSNVHPRHSYSFMSSLRSYGLHTCGATLIAPGRALTAAHCIDLSSPTSRYSLAVFRHHLVGGSSHACSQTIGVLASRRHPSYSGGPNFAFDIAVLDVEPVRSFGVQCASSIEYPALDGSSGGVSLGPAFDVPHAGESAIALGWGSTSYDTATQTSGPTSNELREVTLPVQSDQYCSTHLPGYESPYMLCAGHPSGGHDTCSGDSGGPLILPATAAGAPLTLIAVASWGYGCARPNSPGIYTRVQHFRTWLLTAAGLSPPPRLPPSPPMLPLPPYAPPPLPPPSLPLSPTPPLSPPSPTLHPPTPHSSRSPSSSFLTAPLLQPPSLPIELSSIAQQASPSKAAGASLPTTVLVIGGFCSALILCAFALTLVALRRRSRIAEFVIHITRMRWIESSSGGSRDDRPERITVAASGARSCVAKISSSCVALARQIVTVEVAEIVATPPPPAARAELRSEAVAEIVATPPPPAARAKLRSEANEPSRREQHDERSSAHALTWLRQQEREATD